jgi:hypothetical protein
VPTRPLDANHMVIAQWCARCALRTLQDVTHFATNCVGSVSA